MLKYTYVLREAYKIYKYIKIKRASARATRYPPTHA